jgi:hypothetical protein
MMICAGAWATYATNTFNVLHIALRREMVLALMRLWDTSRGALRLEGIARTLCGPNIINTLAMDRAPFPEARDQMTRDLTQCAGEAIALIDKYSKDGSHYAVRLKLQRMRNERLAHRDMTISATSSPSATDKDEEEGIETFYRDNAEIVRLLSSVVNGCAFNPAEVGEVFRDYAAHFWAGVRGEQTEGHPNFGRNLQPL